jgi:N-acetylmuramoyl-L-alanine amidase
MPGVTPKVHTRLLPYARRLEPRQPEAVDLVIIHCTELPDLETAREYGRHIHYHGTRTGNSGHFYIDRDGRIEAWVDPDRIAHHTRHYNKRSLGIELVNKGRWPDWLHSDLQAMTEPYPSAQIEALLWLLNDLPSTLTSLRWIAGHDQLDRAMVSASDSPHELVRRKRDPGHLFPWKRVLASSALTPFPDRG